MADVSRSMSGHVVLTGLTLLLLVSLGCSDQRVLESAAHPPNYILTHDTDSGGDISRCRTCHGENYQGNGGVPSCFDCHRSGPPFIAHPDDWAAVALDHSVVVVSEAAVECGNAACHGADLTGGRVGPGCYQAAGCHFTTTGEFLIHPASWGSDLETDHQALAPGVTTDSCARSSCHGEENTGGLIAAGGSCNQTGCHDHPISWNFQPFTQHRTFAEQDMSWTECATAPCHGDDLQGNVGPSCYLPSFGDNGCHAAGPPPTHALPYDGERHDRDAAFNQIECQNCHGRPQFDFSGGFVTDLAFVVNADGNCSRGDCHPDARAHPGDWRGPHQSVRPTPSDCYVCHANSGSSPLSGAPSCSTSSFGGRGCHD